MWNDGSPRLQLASLLAWWGLSHWRKLHLSDRRIYVSACQYRDQELDAASSLEKTQKNASADIQTCTVGENNFVRLIPFEHFGQDVHQAVVLQDEFVLYESASEIGRTFCAVFKAPIDFFDDWTDLLKKVFIILDVSRD